MSSGSPITGLATVVGYGDHFDFRPCLTIHKAERKAREDIAAEMAGDSGPALRHLPNAAYRVLQLREEGRCGPGAPSGIPFQGAFRFFSGSRVEAELAISHLAAGVGHP